MLVLQFYLPIQSYVSASATAYQYSIILRTFSYEGEIHTHTSLPSTNITDSQKKKKSTNITILYHNWQKNKRNPNIFTLQRTTNTLTLITISIPCTICISHSEIDYTKLGNGTNSRLRRNLGTDLKSREEWLLAIKKRRSPILQFDHLCRVCVHVFMHSIWSYCIDILILKSHMESTI